MFVLSLFLLALACLLFLLLLCLLLLSFFSGFTVLSVVGFPLCLSSRRLGLFFQGERHAGRAGNPSRVAANPACAVPLVLCVFCSVLEVFFHFLFRASV